MASKEGEAAPATEPVAEKPTEPEAAVAEPADASGEQKAEKPPVDPEEAAKRRAERAEKRKEQRKAARQAAKEAKAAAKAAGEAPPPKKKAEKAPKAAQGELQVPEGAAPKISVAKIPADISIADLRALFQQYGTILRADVSKRRGRPTIGTIVYNTHNEVKRAFNALNGKHKCAGVNDFVSIQYAKDSPALGESLKKGIDAVADCIREYKYKPAVLRSREAKDFLNQMLVARKKAPATELLTAAVLVLAKAATPEELVNCKLVKSAGAVQQILSEKAEAPAKTQEKAPGKGKKEEKSASKLEKTFDAVVPHLDKLEKDRWNRMAKANLRLNERHRFRFVDILATPSLELWRWMVEDCEITPAEAGTCFAILQNYYGFTK